MPMLSRSVFGLAPPSDAKTSEAKISMINSPNGNMNFFSLLILSNYIMGRLI
jgi:hypothetical protein